jgi:hypothetical protein
VEKGTCPLCLGKEDTKHILLECPETNDWRMEMLCKRWLDINEDIAYRKVLSCKKNMVKILENFYSGFHVNGKGRQRKWEHEGNM